MSSISRPFCLMLVIWICWRRRTAAAASRESARAASWTWPARVLPFHANWASSYSLRYAVSAGFRLAGPRLMISLPFVRIGRAGERRLQRDHALKSRLASDWLNVCIPCSAWPVCIMRVDLVHLVLADEVADRRARASGSPSPSRAPCRRSSGSSGWQTIPSSTQRELGADLLLLVGGEDVDDPVDRLRRRVGVQGGEDEVAGLGDASGRLDRLQVAHLADQDHVRVLPQRRAQASAKV